MYVYEFFKFLFILSCSSPIIPNHPSSSQFIQILSPSSSFIPHHPPSSLIIAVYPDPFPFILLHSPSSPIIPHHPPSSPIIPIIPHHRSLSPFIPLYSILSQYICYYIIYILFLLLAHQSVNKAQAFLDYYRIKRIREVPLKPHLPQRPYGDWRDEVSEWWTDWVQNRWHEKKAQLFLYGESNTGKTSFVTDILLGNLFDERKNKLAKKQIYRTPRNSEKNHSRFVYQEFLPDQHTVFYWEEFSLSATDAPSLKLVLEGAPLVIDVKNHRPREIEFRIPIIIVSQVLNLFYIYLNLISSYR